MTSSSSISLRARDFYAGRDYRLCVEKKRQLKHFLFFLLILCQPSNQLAVALSKSKSGLLSEKWWCQKRAILFVFQESESAQRSEAYT